MNDDQLKGKAKEVIGNVKEQVGYWTDDKKVEADGVVMQVEGKVQEAWGDLKDTLDKTAEKMEVKKAEVITQSKKN